MNIINPSTFLLVNTNNVDHVATCASYCYHSHPADNARMYERLINDGHLSMLRHETHYYCVPSNKISSYYVQYFRNNPYCHILGPVDKHFYIVLNGQFCYEHDDLIVKSGITDYPSCIGAFAQHPQAIDLVRLTFVCDTQIAISRELNRVSPNNISERSTRYIDYLRKLGIRFSKPHWYDSLSFFRRPIARFLMRLSNFSYRVARSRYGLNLKAEDARYFLPLGIETRAAYTYTISEWKAIVEKRYHDSTGRAHSDAKAAIKPIHDYIHEFLSLNEQK